TPAVEAMAGLNNGSSTLEEVKEALQELKKFDLAASQVLANEVGRAPSSLRRLDDQLHEIQRLHSAAIVEILLYWKNRDAAHLSSGLATHARALSLMKQCSDHVESELKKLSATPRARLR
ncbi:MAG TPA: hypothetical protein VL403_18865, partial [Candidatus Kryptonia bacterium]|nr:hypothetical protein [Candidatus Kryptonia bacterium]